MVIVETAAVKAAATAAATASTNALFKAATDRVAKSIKGPAKTAMVKALAALSSYGPYIAETNERVSTFKTFADPTKPVSLLDHFVETKFQVARGKPLINQDQILLRLKKPVRLVVSATAGYGKSMVMRYISLALYDNPTGKIPIFLELRNLNRVSSPGIISFIHTSYRRTSDVAIEAFEQGLKSGAFVLILDGFDELNHELRPIIENEILALAREHPACSIIVSGRPDDRFKSWREFTLLKVAPMAKAQVIELINKLEYDRGVRKRFIQKINTGLYETHKSFLSTPLLAILMLLTFEQNANIPDKMYLFYGEAFKTLFHKHDALKEQYDRARKSNLVVDEFEKVFSVFCLKTYVQEKTEFSFNEIIVSIKDALKYEDSDTSAADFLFDIEEAVCLIMKEGASYFFVHRSFQEYFTAVFLANCSETIRDEFIEQVSSRYWDNVLPMLFDMASSQIEPTWVNSRTESYLSQFGMEEGKITPLQSRIQKVQFYKGADGIHLHSFEFGPAWKFLAVMMRFYPSISGGVTLDFKVLERWAEINWKTLPKTIDKDSLGDKVEFVEVELSSIDRGVVLNSKLEDMANAEYQCVVEIDKQIDKQQSAKNEFLKKLFKS